LTHIIFYQILNDEAEEILSKKIKT